MSLWIVVLMDIACCIKLINFAYYFGAPTQSTIMGYPRNTRQYKTPYWWQILIYLLYCYYSVSILECVNSDWAVVVAQLVEHSLPITEVRSSNPVIGKNLFIYWTFVYCQLCVEKTKIKKKRPGMAHLKKPSDVSQIKYHSNIFDRCFCPFCPDEKLSISLFKKVINLLTPAPTWGQWSSWCALRTLAKFRSRRESRRDRCRETVSSTSPCRRLSARRPGWPPPRSEARWTP